MNDRSVLKNMLAPALALVATAALAAAISSRVELSSTRRELDALRRDAASSRVDSAVELARLGAKHESAVARAASDRDTLMRHLAQVEADLNETRSRADSAAAEIASVRQVAARDKADYQKRLVADDLEISTLRMNHESTLAAERKLTAAQLREANAKSSVAQSEARSAEYRARVAEADAAAQRSRPPVVIDNTVYNQTTTVVQPVTVEQPVRIVRVVPRPVQTPASAPVSNGGGQRTPDQPPPQPVVRPRL